MKTDKLKLWIVDGHRKNEKGVVGIFLAYSEYSARHAALKIWKDVCSVEEYTGPFFNGQLLMATRDDS